MLMRADHMLKVGAISPVEHEAVWWQAYDRLEETRYVYAEGGPAGSTKQRSGV